MKALVKYARGEGNVKVMDVPRPECGPEDILVRVHFCGLCGTDIHILHDEFKNNPPVTLGHEFSGVIEQVGAAVEGEWRTDERVVGELHIGSCRQCHLCRKGAPHICDSKQHMGSRSDGALAQYMALPAWLAHRIPADVSNKAAALTEPLAIACHALLERGKLSKPGTLVILGSSTVGLFALLLASALGAERTIISGTGIDEEVRFPLARELGATDTVNVEKRRLGDAVAEVTDNRGADVVIECSGSVPAIHSGIEIVKKTGKFVLLGLTAKESPSIPWNKLLHKEVDVAGCFSSPPSSWRKAIQYLPAIEEKLQKLATHVIALEEWEKGFSMMQSGQAVKVLVDLRDP